ncbi:MAG: phosphatase PAP2 family protein [Saprospiraceae bacterium]|nr:phosphatase PAP2 family protein [Saprospiraceae bacterium]MCB9322228.1 phosphatase PAP2 family protein [Lewinellaceae bacterium]
MNIVKENRYFFVFFGVFLLVAGTFLYKMEQGDAILYFSERRTAFGNFFFKYFTKVGEEWSYPIVLLLLVYAFSPRNYRHFIYVPFLGGLVALISFYTKSYFRHPRPVLFFEHNGTLDEIIKVADVTLYGGMNSFPSGHTMSAFALYAFMAFVVPNKKLGGTLLFLTALLVGISRIYLVQHFLEDVYLGAVIGVLIGMVMYGVMNWMEGKVARAKNGI